MDTAADSPSGQVTGTHCTTDIPGFRPRCLGGSSSVIAAELSVEFGFIYEIT